jgi:hypothetical protein
MRCPRARTTKSGTTQKEWSISAVRLSAVGFSKAER